MKHNFRNRNKGFSLVELVITLVVSGFILIAAFGFLNSATNLFRTTSTNVSLQLEAQVTLNLLEDVIIEAVDKPIIDDSTDYCMLRIKSKETDDKEYYNYFCYDKNTSIMRYLKLDEDTYAAAPYNNANYEGSKDTVIAYMDSNIDKVYLSKYLSSFVPSHANEQSVVTLNMEFSSNGHKYTSDSKLSLRNETAYLTPIPISEAVATPTPGSVVITPGAGTSAPTSGAGGVINCTGPSDVTFAGPLTETYDDNPLAVPTVSVRITNESADDVSLACPASSYMQVDSGISFPVTIKGNYDGNNYIDLNISLKAGLLPTAVAQYEYLRFYVSGTTAEAYKVKANYHITNADSFSIDRNNIVFDPKPEGYSISTINPETLRITNNSTNVIAVTSVTLSPGDKFVMALPGNLLSIAPGDSRDISIMPNVGLSTGDYSTNVIITTGNGSTKSVPCHFRVVGAVYSMNVNKQNLNDLLTNYNFIRRDLGYTVTVNDACPVDIRNTGNVKINIAASCVDAAGNPSDLFNINCYSGDILPSDKGIAMIYPKQGLPMGTYSAYIKFQIVGTTIDKTVSVTFEVGGEALTVNTTAFNLNGNTPFHRSLYNYHNVTAQIKNTTTQPIAIRVEPMSASSVYKVTLDGGNNERTLSAGEAVTVRVMLKGQPSESLFGGLTQKMFTDTFCVTNKQTGTMISRPISAVLYK